MANRELTELKWQLWDLDDTLSKGRSFEDYFANPEDIPDPIPENLTMALEAVKQGKKIVVFTSRPWDHHPLIEQWLNKWEIPFEGIICGKPLASKIIDDKSCNPNCNECRQRFYDELK